MNSSHFDLRELSQLAGIVVLVGLLLAAAWSDWRTWRIPNRLTVSGMVFGIAWNVFTAPTAPAGLGIALGGLATGLALFMPLYILRVLGAGDVKLLAMVGAFLGTIGILQATLLIGIVGGLAVIAFTLSRRVHRQLAGNLRDIAISVVAPGMPLWRPAKGAESVGKLPYGASICLGTVAYLVLRAYASL